MIVSEINVTGAMMKSKDEKWSVFWCGLLHPVIFGEIEKTRVHSYLRELASKQHLFPDGRMRQPSLSTLKRKLAVYRKRGFEGLARKTRTDQGCPRAAAPEVIKKAIELKRDQGKRSNVGINIFLKSLYGKTLAKSTMYRHLKKAGATKLKLGITKTKIRRRWTRDISNELWVGDFEDGPYVLHDGEAGLTHLSLFIDCHSRFIVAGRYYLRETLDILIDTLLRAWAVHGTSIALYLDNAKIYHANALKTACYSLNINLLHRAKGDPPPGGLVERFFGTAQSQFEAEVRAGDILTLEKLNRAFSAYLSMVYHEQTHSETHQSPRERYEKGLRTLRHVDMDRAVEFFMRKETRTVNPIFCDIRLDGRFYRTDRKLRGDRLEVRYDPYAHSDHVLLYSLDDEQYLGKAILHHREKGEDAPANPKTAKPKHDLLGLIIQQHDEKLRDQARGIDYTGASSHKQWPFISFVKHLARLMGRRGGLSGFSTEDFEALKKIYSRHPHLTETLLTEAFTAAEGKSILEIAYQIQIMKKQQKEE